MMEQDQLSRLCRGCDLTCHQRSGVPIPLCSRKPRELPAIMRFQILCVMDEHIRIFSELHKPAVCSHIALGICGVHNRLAAPRDSIDIDSTRMGVRLVDADDDCIISRTRSCFRYPTPLFIPNDHLRFPH